MVSAYDTRKVSVAVAAPERTTNRFVKHLIVHVRCLQDVHLNFRRKLTICGGPERVRVGTGAMRRE